MLQVIRESGWTGLFQGLQASLLGTAVSQGVYFYFYSLLRQFFVARHQRLTLTKSQVGCMHQCLQCNTMDCIMASGSAIRSFATQSTGKAGLETAGYWSGTIPAGGLPCWLWQCAPHQPHLVCGHAHAGERNLSLSIHPCAEQTHWPAEARHRRIATRYIPQILQNAGRRTRRASRRATSM